MVFLNDIHGDMRVGLTGHGISVLVVVQNRFLGLRALLGRLSWFGIARARRRKRRKVNLTLIPLKIVCRDSRTSRRHVTFPVTPCSLELAAYLPLFITLASLLNQPQSPMDSNLSERSKTGKQSAVSPVKISIIGSDDKFTLLLDSQ